jgi:hypothetical protein
MAGTGKIALAHVGPPPVKKELTGEKKLPKLNPIILRGVVVVALAGWLGGEGFFQLSLLSPAGLRCLLVI